jgi:TolB protein
MNADGSGQTRLTDNVADDNFSAWSPDGKQIVFCSDRDGQTDLYLMNVDGSGLSRLTDFGTGGNGGCAPANWSPDGTKIVFPSSHEFGHSEIYVIDVDGSGLTCLTCDIPGAQVGDGWSPDGTQIVFNDSQGVLYAMNADGSNPIRLRTEQRGWWPQWQP